MGRGLGSIGASVVLVPSCYPYLPHPSRPGSSGSSNLSRSSLLSVYRQPQCSTKPTSICPPLSPTYVTTYSNHWHQPHCSSSHGKVIRREFLPQTADPSFGPVRFTPTLPPALINLIGPQPPRPISEPTPAWNPALEFTLGKTASLGRAITSRREKISEVKWIGIGCRTGNL